MNARAFRVLADLPTRFSWIFACCLSAKHRVRRGLFIPIRWGFFRWIWTSKVDFPRLITLVFFGLSQRKYPFITSPYDSEQKQQRNQNNRALENNCNKRWKISHVLAAKSLTFFFLAQHMVNSTTKKQGGRSRETQISCPCARFISLCFYPFSRPWWV